MAGSKGLPLASKATCLRLMEGMAELVSGGELSVFARGVMPARG
jgi:hypothetical protein